MLGGVVLVAGYDLPDCIARLLVQVALALDALDAVGCNEKKAQIKFRKCEENFPNPSYPTWSPRTATGLFLRL